MNLSVVIPTWRGRRLLGSYLPSVFEALASFERSEEGRVPPQTEVVVVEDAGGDDTPEWLRKNYGDGVRLIEHHQNEGFCGACTTGFKAARFPYVLLLNNDVRLAPDCIAPMAAHFDDPELFAVTGKIYNQSGDQFCNGGKIARFRRGMWSTYANYDLPPDAVVDAGRPLLSFTAIGAFSLYAREKYLELGGFDDLALMVEDVEISYGAWKRGWTIHYEPRAVAYHDASQTMDRRYRRRRLDKISRRSRILMHWMLLHEPRMFRQHLLALTGRILTSWLYLDWRFYWAIATGLAHLAHIRSKRRQTRSNMRRTDRELRELLDEFYRTAPIELR